MGQRSTPEKVAAARINGVKGGAKGGRPTKSCPRCQSKEKLLHRTGSLVRRVCRDCLKTDLPPGQFWSQWKHWHPEKWKAVEIDSRPLKAFSREEIHDKQRRYYENSAKLQGALDAALLSFSQVLPAGRVRAVAISNYLKASNFGEASKNRLP